MFQRRIIFRTATDDAKINCITRFQCFFIFHRYIPQIIWRCCLSTYVSKQDAIKKLKKKFEWQTTFQGNILNGKELKKCIQMRRVGGGFYCYRHL